MSWDGMSTARCWRRRRRGKSHPGKYEVPSVSISILLAINLYIHSEVTIWCWCYSCLPVCPSAESNNKTSDISPTFGTSFPKVLVGPNYSGTTYKLQFYYGLNQVSQVKVLCVNWRWSQVELGKSKSASEGTRWNSRVGVWNFQSLDLGTWKKTFRSLKSKAPNWIIFRINEFFSINPNQPISPSQQEPKRNRILIKYIH